MATFGEWAEQKKKKNLSVTEIAPVKVQEKEKTWLEPGAFKDGYQFGDVTKTILGTVGDIAEDASTGVLGMGEAFVDTMMFLSPFAAEPEYYQQGGVYHPRELQEHSKEVLDEMKRGNTAFVAKDLYNEEAIAKALISQPIKSVTGFDIEKSSVLGAEADSLAQSGGQLLAKAGLQAVGVPWFLTTGVTSFGAEAENAARQGATKEEAGLSAAITAGAEILTELLSGGISFGGKTADEGLSRMLATSISNKLARNVLKISGDIAGESAEEVLSEAIGRFGQWITYQDDKTVQEMFLSEEAVDSYIDAAIGGGILGGLSSTVKAVKSEAKGADYVSGLTKNEKAVFDKVYNDAIAEREADGKKLTQSEKTKLYDETMKALEKGYIDTDTIESTLGGESYDSYKAITEQESALKKEIETLENLPKEQITVKQSERLTEARQKLKELDLDTPKNQLSMEVSEIAKGDRLIESYNERTRRSQVFEADLTKYDKKQAEVVKKAMDSGILNNTNKTHDFVDMIAKISADTDISFDFTNNQRLKESGFAVDGKEVNGFVKDGNVSINIDSSKSLNSVVGHEITHVLEGTELYGELQKAVKEYSEMKGEYSKRLEAIRKIYEGVEGANVDAEITADLVGDYLFTDIDFISRLSTEKPNVFKRIFDEIKYLCKVATAGSKEARELEKVKRAFEKAYQERGNVSDNVKYSLQSIENMDEKGYNHHGWAKVNEVLSDEELADFQAKVGDKARQGKWYMPLGNGKSMFAVGKDGVNSVLVISDGNYQAPSIDKVYRIGLDNETDIEIIREVLYESEKDSEWALSSDAIKEIYGDEIVSAYTIDDFEGYRQLSGRAKRTEGEGSLGNSSDVRDGRRSGSTTQANKLDTKASSNDGVFFDAENSGIKYSISDSDGRQLSDKQKEYFKDSKVRDENGNLKLMYHGTADEFTVFNPFLKGGKNGIAEGYGIYFADTPLVSEAYGGKLMKGYLNITRPATSYEKTIKKSELVKLIKATSEAEAQQYVDDGEYDNLEEALRDTWISNYVYTYDISINEAYKQVADSILSSNESDMHIVQEVMLGNGVRDYKSAYEFYDILRETLGIDGFITEWENNNVGVYSKIALAFYSNQFKNVDNLTPTTEPDIRKSLSDGGEHPVQRGNYNVYGRDVALQQDIAPAAEEVQEPVETVQEDIAPVVSDTEVAESVDWREEVRNMREPKLYYGRWKEEYIDYHNTVRRKAQKAALQEALDNFDSGMTPAELRQKAKEALEEYESAKPVSGEEYTQAQEVMLAALYGQYSFYDSVAEDPNWAEEIREQLKQPPMTEELAPITEEQANEQDERKFYSLDENSGMSEQTNTSEVAPLYEAQPNKGVTEGQLSMFNEAERDRSNVQNSEKKKDAKTKDNNGVAKILVEEPENGKKKSNSLLGLAEELVDKGLVFEILSKKTKNRNLEAKWNFIRYADGMAQNFIGNGADGVRPLADIQEEVNKAGLTEKLYEYVYHKHNIDRMSLENRYKDVTNKAVFGDSVTADVSREVVSRLESQYPALKKYANEIYAFNNYLRQMLVDGGVISKETADLWSEMYPNYVPIRRTDDVGLNINVPLDTRRTGINAPVKKAVGGSEDIRPLFDTMAQRAFQTYKAVAKNRFGVELKNTLGTTVETEATDIDGIIEGIEAHDELLKEGKNGKNPTFTVFDKGEKVTFEITEDMYDALKPTNRKLAKKYKIPNLISNIHRSVLTEFNPAFLARNFIKDAQDVLINSQHPVRTYKNFPKAISEMSKKGKWFTEYMKNGGEQNTYFDRENNTFTKEKSGLSKAIGIPFEAISNANNAIERLPRLAEYIASRESGKGIEESMLDAARVTTNFLAGGDFTKFLNRNGVTFLNASVQGFAQQVRNLAEAKMNGFKGWAQLATKFAVAGLPVLLLNGLLWDDDEEYEDLSDYVKQNYYIIAKYGDGKFVRIPKGRMVAVIQDALQQTMNSLTGDDEADWEAFKDLFFTNLAPNDPVDNNILSPIRQVAKNETWYGDDLIPTRLEDLPPSEQYDESTDEISKWLGEKTNISPYKINYLIDQYTGVVGDVVLPMFTPEAESGDDSLLGNLLAPVKSAFTTDSVMNNQNVSDFYDTSDELTMNANKAYATDEDVLANKYFNSVKTEVGKLYAEKREIQNSDLSDAEKYYLVRETQKKIDALAKEGLSEYEDVEIDGIHATVGDLQYRKTDSGWTKITDKQIDKQEDVTSGLGISASDYWNNKEEYDFAYEYPGKYAVSNLVGGYDKYIGYADAIGDFDAKDENGNTVSGLKKTRTKEYIFGLDLDYGQKAILYRTYYDSQKDKEEYDSVIKKYLNSRDDITYDDIVEIYKALGIQ